MNLRQERIHQAQRAGLRNRMREVWHMHRTMRVDRGTGFLTPTGSVTRGGISLQVA